MKQSIHIVDQHHQVLIHWAALRRELTAPPAVWSLDYHTDTLPCFRGNAPAPETGAYLIPGTVENAVAALRHDEHFDWALRAGVVGEINLGICGAETDIIAHSEIRVCRPAGLPPPEIILNSPESARGHLENFLSDTSLRQLFHRLPEPGETYILDIDCDCILSAGTLEPDNSFILDHLIENAALITLSCENDWVKLLKLPGENITGTAIADKLRSRAEQLRREAK